MRPTLYKTHGGVPLRRRTAFITALKHAVVHSGLKNEPGILQIIVMDAKRMAELNERHLQHQGSTDVLTFDLRNQDDIPQDDDSQDDIVTAEIYICPEVAIQYAHEHQLDPSRELLLYAVHGMLHLVGYDDIEDNDRAQMRQAEARVMKKLEEDNVSTTGFLDEVQLL